MAKKFNHTQSFAHFGTKPVNVNWSWSARNEDAKTVVVTLWQDEFSRKGNRRVYERGPIWANSRNSPGHNEMMRNLRWALDHCDGWVKVIIARAKDKNAKPRSIDECFPSNMLVKVLSVDEASGAFELEDVGFKSQSSAPGQQ
ncbi:hypothetical protein ACWTU6_27175 [Mesorhizobium sp. BHbsci]